MIRPDTSQIQQLAGEYPIIPICREIYADVATTMTLLRRLSAISSRYYLLESVEGGEKWGRYSFLGYDPVMRVTCKDRTVTIESEEEVRTIRTEAPLKVLRDILQSYRSPKIAGMPPFTGGFVGYFAYSMIGYAEPVLNISGGDFNDYDLMLFDKVIAYDHLRQKICLVANMKTDDVLQNYGKAMAQLENMAAVIRDHSPLPVPKSDRRVSFTCSVTKEEYCRVLEKTKDYIREGDIFQAVISR